MDDEGGMSLGLEEIAHDFDLVELLEERSKVQGSEENSGSTDREQSPDQPG